MTVTISQACQIGKSFTFTYGNVTAQSTAGTAIFTTATRSGSTGSFTNIDSSPTVTVNAVKSSQNITITTHAPSTATYGTSFSVAATASSGLTVAFSTSGSCTNSGSTVTMTAGTGSCTVKYDQAGNSSFNAATELTESVTAQQAALTVSGVTANSKVYDRTTAATLNTAGASLVGIVGTDSVTLNTASAIGTFANKNIGTAKSVTISGLALGGTKASNYTLIQPTATANITTRNLTVSATGVNKVYDGNASATVTLSDNRVSGDTLTASYTTASFSDKNVGTAKTVSVSGISISGPDSGNYLANNTATTTANITARPITVTADSITKVAGTTDPALTYKVTSGSLAGTDTFGGALSRDSGETVGTYNINQGTLSAGGNYNLSFVSGTFTIIAAPILSVTPVTTPINNPLVAVTFSTNNISAGQTVECKLDSGSFAACSSPYNTPSLADGSHTVTVEVVNSSNAFLTSASTTFVVDTTAPHLTLDSLTTNNTGPTITGTSDDTAVVTLSVTDSSSNATTFTATPSSGHWSVNIPGPLADGVYSLAASSTDVANNTGTATGSLTVDTTAPSLAINPIAENAFMITGTTDNSATAVTVTVNGSTTNATLDGSGNWSSNVGIISPDGKYPVSVAATNGLGTQALASSTLIIDTTPPVITLVGDPNPDVTLTLHTPYNEPGYSATDNIDGDIKSKVSVDSSKLDINTVGNYSITYDVTDNAGNQATERIRVVRVVLPPPPVISNETFVFPPTDNSITVTWTTDLPSTSTVIYDIVTHDPLDSAATAPDYGYANSTVEDSTLVTPHSVTITGLNPNTLYFFRPVSDDGSPATVGTELSTTTEAFGGGGGGIGTGSPTGGATPTDNGNNGNGSNNNPQTPQVLGATITGPAHPDGTLVLSGKTIYLIQNGQLFGFRDPNEYKSYGYNFNQTVTATPADLALPFDASKNILKAMAGTLVLDSTDNRTVYMIGSNGTKRGFVSPAVFTGLGYSFNNLLSINLSDYTTGPVIDSATAAHPEGALVLDADGKTVWWILGGSRQGFESEAVFNTYGFDFSRVVPANAADLALAQSSLVKFRDGTLVQNGGNYYIISDGTARQFASLDDFTNFGYSTANLISSSLANYQAGTEVALK